MKLSLKTLRSSNKFNGNILRLQSKGFTIIELLIVIVVIGILAALVLNSVAGVQGRGRDRERQTDMNSLATQLEAYYQDNGGYPLLATVSAADATLQTTFKGADVGIFKAPGQAANTMVTAGTGAAPTPTIAQYGYYPLAADGTTVCAAAPCAKFILAYRQEADSVVKTKTSLN